jgi:hypothetical protein
VPFKNQWLAIELTGREGLDQPLVLTRLVLWRISTWKTSLHRRQGHQPFFSEDPGKAPYLEVRYRIP